MSGESVDRWQDSGLTAKDFARSERRPFSPPQVGVPVVCFRMEPRDIVQRTLAIWAATPNAGDDEIVGGLVAQGVTEKDAWRAWHLVPSAFSRALFGSLGVQFKDELLFVDETNQVTSRRKLSDDSMFSAARDVATATRDPEALIAIARHGAEFGAIAPALKDGASYKDISLDSLMIVDLKAFTA
jgi:hypothetical protein